MKKCILIFILMMTYGITINAQGLNGLLKDIKGDTSSTVNKFFGKLKKNKAGLSEEEIINGLKEALETGSQKSSDKLSAVDGYFTNLAIKILLPPEAHNVTNTLRSLGLNKQVDELILTMNRAAELAAKEAGPIFINAVKQMTIADGLSILKGSDTAATTYLRAATSTQLTAAFKPIIDNALSKLNVAHHWDKVFTTYNKFSMQKVNTDLNSYVTGKALDGLFYQVAKEETEIRKNPAARTTKLLKKVFGN